MFIILTLNLNVILKGIPNLVLQLLANRDWSLGIIFDSVKQHGRANIIDLEMRFK